LELLDALEMSGRAAKAARRRHPRAQYGESTDSAEADVTSARSRSEDPLDPKFHAWVVGDPDVELQFDPETDIVEVRRPSGQIDKT
jgi:TFIIF-interacting CTD phosphatase-like protein